jgi:hypothetical protein
MGNYYPSLTRENTNVMRNRTFRRNQGQVVDPTPPKPVVNRQYTRPDVLRPANRRSVSQTLGFMAAPWIPQFQKEGREAIQTGRELAAWNREQPGRRPNPVAGRNRPLPSQYGGDMSTLAEIAIALGIIPGRRGY